jgi:hypothetical protein
MAGTDDPPVEPLRSVTSVDSRSPILITGLSAAAVLGGSGDLSLIRETRGADLDWGGVYGETVRLTGPWWFRYGSPDGTRCTLTEVMNRLESSRTRVSSHHEIPLCQCDQEIIALAGVPGVGRRLTFTNASDSVRSVQITTTFRPELAPVLIEGIKPFEYEAVPTPTGLRVTAFGSSLEFALTAENPEYRLNDEPWDGRRFRGALGSVTAESTLELPPGGSGILSYVIWGGMEATVRANPDRSAQLLAGAHRWAAEADQAFRGWTAQTPRVRLPEAPELERAYLLGRDALRSLYFSPEPGLVGLLAGYPWYAALWCRDLAWMLPAVLWLGDAPWVAASLRSVFRFQARADLPILGGAAGELPMQIGPGPVFLYGTSDTTLYYPELVRKYFAHTGDVTLVRELAHSLQLAEQWGRRKTNPDTGLMRNGDEGAGLQQASEEHGRVHYGFDAFDTTIWDSTDRRAHAVDIQVLWADALEAMGELAPILGAGSEANAFHADAQRVRESVARRYWWADEDYLYDSLAIDGSPIRKIRPNALLAVARGILPPARAAAALARSARPDLATEWGLRTLSSGDPTYDPMLYHDGQVWPIASAWAIAAAFATGQHGRAVDGLRQWARMLDSECGTLNECYRGDQAAPFNSCFLLGFSVGPFLTQLFEGLWGLTPQTGARSLRIEPRFPPDWAKGSIEGLALFGGEVSLHWKRPEMSIDWTGTGKLRVEGGGQILEIATGKAGTIRYPATPEST